MPRVLLSPRAETWVRGKAPPRYSGAWTTWRWWSLGFETRELASLESTRWLTQTSDLHEGETMDITKYRTCVYFIQPTGGGLVKIGKTSAWLDQRLEQIQANCPHALFVVHAIPTSSACLASVERELHSRFASKRIHHEWFRLSDSDLEEVKADFPNPVTRENR